MKFIINLILSYIFYLYIIKPFFNGLMNQKNPPPPDKKNKPDYDDYIEIK